MIYIRTAASRLCLSSLFCIAACLLVALPAGAQSFTANRLNDGRQQLQVGNYADAIVEFNLAAIGLLDQPTDYVHCKTLLFLAQIGARERAQAKATLLLIARVEEQLNAYSEANMPEQDRAAFEATVLQEFGNEAFTQSPRFGALIQEAALQNQPTIDSAESSLGDLRTAAEMDPQDPQALEALTLRLYQGRKVADAQRASDQLIAVEPDNPNGRCIKAATTAARNRSLCERYLPEISQCPAALQTPFLIETRLTCHLETRSYNAGRDFVLSLTPAALNAAKANGLVRKINKRADPLDTPASTEAQESPLNSSEPESAGSEQTEVQQEASAGTTEVSEPVVPNPQDDLSNAAALTEIAELTRQGTAAASSGDRNLLLSTQARVRELADTYPNLEEAQLIAGRFAYLLRDWPTVAYYFERAPDFISGSANSTYYLAVALWESGRQAEARTQLLRAIDLGLLRTDAVRDYESKMFPGTP